MSKLFEYVHRFGPLVASLVLGASAVLPANFKPIADAVTALLGVAGVSADPAAVSNIGLIVSGVLALIGVVKKSVSLATK